MTSIKRAGDSKTRIIEVSARRRIFLGALAKSDYYLAELREDGTIVLTPAVVLPVTEVTL
jgi:hypothetical protein